MRDIKFRAWCKTKGLNRMYFLTGFFKYGEGWTGGNPDYKFYQLFFGDGFSRVTAKDYIFMQFTGLHDKNGKEIYEGDILRSEIKTEFDKENFSCYEVFFHDGDANSDYNIGYTMNRMHNHGSMAGGYIPQFKPRVTAVMVVCGNIYENPNLLK